jgi:acyl-CoA reductase-like NAD-dependent aldehyde dehydrogenase
MKMYISGEWTESPQKMEIRSPHDGQIVDTVPSATAEQVDRSIAAAERGAAAMAKLPAHERSQVLNRAADLVAKSVEDLARTVTAEMGKPLKESRGEVSRLPDLLRLCAFEGTQLRGETLPLDAQAGTTGKLGFTLRVPCGVVVAITPFNYPLLLVVHKIGPALAAGNAVILKPANQTPLSALKLTRLMLEAGLPDNALQCITGPGETVGPPLCSDTRVRKISFTGSVPVGRQIAHTAGIKKLSLELGSNCPVVILPDGDVELAASATAIGGYVNAGQVCISTQRVLVDRKVYGAYLEALQPKVESIKVGDPLKEDTVLASMISEKEATRLQTWVREATANGARIVTGGQRDGAVVTPTIVADVKPGMKISCEELFGPAVAVTPVESVDEAIALASDSRFGLGAGIFTRDIAAAMRFARRVPSGNIQINWTPLWRADLMPYGGFKESGIGKEGPRYAVEAMTEIKTVTIHGID